MDAVNHILKNYESVSIIGMDKNVGKTTTLNYIINQSKGNTTLGITSIGRDGEEEDIVTSTPKPKIYVQRGSIIATAKSCFLSSDITKEILKTTGINTPMGEIIIFRALSDGYVQLAGPSLNSQLEHICKTIKSMGVDTVIADGALSRKTFASPSVTQSTILCTGASLDRDINKVVANTVHTVNLLSIENEKDENIVKIAREILAKTKIGIIYKDNTVENLDVLTTLDKSKDIVEKISDNSKYIVMDGIVSDKLFQNIMKGTDKYSQVVFLLRDATKLFLSKDTLYKFIKTGGKIKVIDKINLIGVSVNPKSPYGYEFNKDRFLELLRNDISLDVFDVIGGG